MVKFLLSKVLHPEKKGEITVQGQNDSMSGVISKATISYFAEKMASKQL